MDTYLIWSASYHMLFALLYWYLIIWIKNFASYSSIGLYFNNVLYGMQCSSYFFIAEQSAGNKNGYGRRPANRYHKKVAA